MHFLGHCGKGVRRDDDRVVARGGVDIVGFGVFVGGGGGCR